MFDFIVYTLTYTLINLDIVFYDTLLCWMIRRFTYNMTLRNGTHRFDRIIQDILY